MAVMMVKFEWDDSLGERWMNIDNLKSCLHGTTYVHEAFLSVEEVVLEEQDQK
jgi:hypothetical protein